MSDIPQNDQETKNAPQSEQEYSCYWDYRTQVQADRAQKATHGLKGKAAHHAAYVLRHEGCTPDQSRQKQQHGAYQTILIHKNASFLIKSYLLYHILPQKSNLIQKIKNSA